MCGIAGIIAPELSPERRKDVLGKMLAELSARGPDGSGEYDEGPVAFGHRRLAILDLSSRADQPMYDRISRTVITYNGEVYNFRALQEELAARGRSFASSGDTEVVLQAYAEWGEGCFGRFNGMFALAIYDMPARRIVFARDRFGKKPLFYHRDRTRLLFASTVRAIAVALDRLPPLDPRALDEYLACGYTLGTRTIFEGIEEVPPGECVTLPLDGFPDAPPTRRRFWNPGILLGELDAAKAPSAHPIDLAAASQRFGVLLELAVRRRLISDRPVGLYISGGVDSSVVCALAAKHLARPDIKTFCCVFDEPGFSEEDSARATARHLGLDFVPVNFPAPNLAGLRAFARALGEPLGDSSAWPMTVLAERAKRDVAVVLAGDGADEVLGGYATYRATELADSPWLDNGMMRALLALMARHAPVRHAKIGWDYKLRAFAAALPHSFPARHFWWRGLSDAALRRRICRDELVVADEPRTLSEIIAEFGLARSSLATFTRARALDFHTWLCGDILPKVDMSGMAHGLEVRSPFLDPELVEYSAGLPEHFLRGPGGSKLVLRRFAESLLPAAVNRRPKQGFNAPVHRWLSRQLRGDVAEILGQADTLSAGALRGHALRELLEEHCTGRADHGFLLWSVVVLLLWLESLS